MKSSTFKALVAVFGFIQEPLAKLLEYLTLTKKQKVLELQIPLTELELMGFDGALRYMRIDMKFTRKSWGSNVFAHMREDSEGITYIYKNTNGTEMIWDPPLEDILAEDWMIYVESTE